MALAYGFASRSAILACALIFVASATAFGAQDNPQGSSPDTPPIVLVPHRAVYDLSLGETRGNAQIVGVRGRILYDFDGNACDGYTLQFRQVSELDSGEGKISTSDLRSTTWEGSGAKRFKFTSENLLDDKLIEAVDGRAERGAKATTVDLIKPQEKKFDIDPAVVFPTEHMVRVIEAARAGKAILDFPVFDGSDSGDKVYDTLTVIGHKLSSDERKHDDAADAEPKLSDVPRWPVTISYFDKGRGQKTTEQTPAYAIGFELYANGISRALSLDYNDFVVAGKLTSLEIKQPKPCR
jgi:hypothetical protein